jgi:RNA polymerase sigma-70 factor, ECF subfamily
VPQRSEEAFRRHYGQVFRYIRRRVATDDDADELTQTVFVDAAAALERFRPGATPMLALLYTVAQRRLADRARLFARRGQATDLDTVPLHAVGTHEYSGDVAGAIRRALDELPETQRRVVAMKLLQGISFAEIACETRATEAACKMRFSRGLEAIKAVLEGEGIAP